MRKTFIVAILSIIAINFVFASNLIACTNYLVSKGASTDGSVMITYNADAGGFMEPLYFSPARDYKEGDSVAVYDWDSGKYLGKIKQVLHTYSVIGNINEYEVSLGETTFGGRSELRDTDGKIDYGSLMYLALQRAKNAREAIQVMGDLVAEYGYYSSGESFSVADANEAWILEMVGKGSKERGALWAARRVPDGYVCAHANQSRIREVPVNDPENCMFQKDIFEYSKKKGWYKPDSAAFSFVDCYCPLEPEGLLFCEGRVWRFFSRVAPSQNFSEDYWRAVKGAEPYPLFIKPDKKISPQELISMMRDHFEGTKYDMTKGAAAGPFACPIRWKGLLWKLPGDTVTEYAWERPVSTQQTAFAFCSQLRSNMPREIGGVFWYGDDDNYSNVYMPLYCCMNKAPKSFTGGSLRELDLNSAFWVFNLVANLAYSKYSIIIKDIQKVQSELENKFFAYQPAIETAAMQLYEKDPKLAVDFLTDYSVNTAESTVSRWKDLWYELVPRYNDGYINDVSQANGRHPKSSGYGEEFLRNAVNERPEYYKVKWREKKPNNP